MMRDKLQAHAGGTLLSPVHTAHSLLCLEESDSKQLPIFEELNSEAQIQAEVAKRLHQCDHLSKTEQGFNSISTDAIVNMVVIGQA